MQRGHKPRQPYARQPLLISCYGFKIIDGVLKVPVGDKQYFDIPLNNYAKQVLSDPSFTLHSFTLTASNIVSVCYSKQVTTIDYTKIAGIDRNLHNVTIGDCKNVTQYDLSKTVDIAKNTRSIMKSFRRNDVRIRSFIKNMAKERRIVSINFYITYQRQ